MSECGNADPYRQFDDNDCGQLYLCMEWRPDDESGYARRDERNINNDDGDDTEHALHGKLCGDVDGY